jgi:DNA/RNA-binding domain of Phe-tRNA-synthetase-like protein
MTRLLLEEKVAAAFPEAEVRLVVAVDLDNSAPWPETEQLMAEVERAAVDGTLERFDESDPRLASWHDAYRAFGTNPKRMRPSVDALVRRARKNGALPRISPAVDAYNAVSVLAGVPAGAFDLDQIAGDIHIRYGLEQDTFEPLGEPGTWESVGTGEVVYADAQTVLTRHWNHRDCNKAMVRPDSHTVVFLLERISDRVPGPVLAAAADRLAAAVGGHSRGVTTHLLGPATPDVTLTA